MRILVGCEFSGTVRDAFIEQGYFAMSCDLLPSDKPGPHYQGDVRDILHENWDLFIVHPDCTYLCSSGLHWNKRVPERAQKTVEALSFIREMMAAPIPKIAIENPVGCISTEIDARDYGFRTQKATQYIQPYDFGHDASKKTGLWLKNLPSLSPTKTIQPRLVNGKKRWGNQTDSGQNRLPPSENRWKIRATTYQGIAEAMALQLTR